VITLLYEGNLSPEQLADLRAALVGDDVIIQCAEPPVLRGPAITVDRYTIGTFNIPARSCMIEADGRPTGKRVAQWKSEMNGRPR
jgi:hypothetical protein